MMMSRCSIAVTASVREGGSRVTVLWIAQAAGGKVPLGRQRWQSANSPRRSCGPISYAHTKRPSQRGADVAFRPGSRIAYQANHDRWNAARVTWLSAENE